MLIIFCNTLLSRDLSKFNLYIYEYILYEIYEYYTIIKYVPSYNFSKKYGVHFPVNILTNVSKNIYLIMYIKSFFSILFSIYNNILRPYRVYFHYLKNVLCLISDTSVIHIL